MCKCVCVRMCVCIHTCTLGLRHCLSLKLELMWLAELAGKKAPGTFVLLFPMMESLGTLLLWLFLCSSEINSSFLCGKQLTGWVTVGHVNYMLGDGKRSPVWCRWPGCSGHKHRRGVKETLFGRDAELKCFGMLRRASLFPHDLAVFLIRENSITWQSYSEMQS